MISGIAWLIVGALGLRPPLQNQSSWRTSPQCPPRLLSSPMASNQSAAVTQIRTALTALLPADVERLQPQELEARQAVGTLTRAILNATDRRDLTLALDVDRHVPARVMWVAGAGLDLSAALDVRHGGAPFGQALRLLAARTPDSPDNRPGLSEARQRNLTDNDDRVALRESILREHLAERSVWRAPCLVKGPTGKHGVPCVGAAVQPATPLEYHGKKVVVVGLPSVERDAMLGMAEMLEMAASPLDSLPEALECLNIKGVAFDHMWLLAQDADTIDSPSVTALSCGCIITLVTPEALRWTPKKTGGRVATHPMTWDELATILLAAPSPPRTRSEPEVVFFTEAMPLRILVLDDKVAGRRITAGVAERTLCWPSPAGKRPWRLRTAISST